MTISKRRIETTTASPKGQVVIPLSLRKQLKIEPGTKFAVYGRKDTLIFKKIELPTMEDFEKLVDFGVKFARRKDIKEEDVLKDD